MGTLSNNDVLEVTDLMDLILKINYVIFEGSIYRQTQDVSMGSPSAPAFANLFMLYWETKYIFKTNYFKGKQCVNHL